MWYDQFGKNTSKINHQYLKQWEICFLKRGNQFFFFAEDSGNKAYIYKLIKARPRYVLKTTFSSFPTVCQLLNCGECVPRLTSSYEFKFFACLKSYLSHEMRTFWPYVKKLMPIVTTVVKVKGFCSNLKGTRGT